MNDASNDPVLFLPGPTQVDPDVLKELSRPALSHRSAEIEVLIAELQRGLQELLGTREPVLLFTSSATLVMEAALLNTVGERGVLHLTCGAFGDRWVKISQSLGKKHEVLEAPWGRGFTADDVARALAQRSYDAVCLTHNETSTGVLNPLREIAAVIREQEDTLLLVDAVSSMAAVQIPFDEWGIDVLLAGVQKAFALPPGLAVAAVSERTYQRAERIPHRGFYTDFLDARRYLAKNQTPSTPSTPHFYALRRQLERILEEGVAQRAARHQEMARQTQEWARQRWSLYAREPFLSPTVTCVQVPAGFDPAALRDGLRAQGILLGGGYGKLKPTTFRIGHMGDHTPDAVADLRARIDAWCADHRSGA